MENVQRKISKIGNSYGVTIPVSMLEDLGLHQGDLVRLERVEGGIHLTKDQQVSLPDGLSPDFFDQLEETLTHYDSTIKGLIDR